MKFTRKVHLKLGRRGENTALALLESKGCELLARNWRIKSGELDLVVLDGETLVFVEVKTLRKRGIFRPLDNLSALQLRRNRRAAHSYWRSIGKPPLQMRMDLVEVVISRWGVSDIRHHCDFSPPPDEPETIYYGEE